MSTAVGGAREALACARQPGKPQVPEIIQPVLTLIGDVVLPRELGAVVEDRVPDPVRWRRLEPHHHAAVRPRLRCP